MFLSNTAEQHALSSDWTQEKAADWIAASHHGEVPVYLALTNKMHLLQRRHIISSEWHASDDADLPNKSNSEVEVERHSLIKSALFNAHNVD